MKRQYLFTSESVSEGHPDKICDQISDVILDLYLTRDHLAKVAVETFAIKDKIIVAGEIRTEALIHPDDIRQSVINTIRHIGYEQEYFHWNKIGVDVNLNRQSPDIAIGVDGGEGKEEGAGDQGLMFGYACKETPDLMPAAIYYSHQILRNIFTAIHKGELSGLGPDAKSQVTLLYDAGKPVRAHSIVVSIQHTLEISQQQVREMIRPYVIDALPNISWMCKEEGFYVNPTGLFTIGGPEGDTGLTGRKIIVDTYGGSAPHGGGAFSGKDPSKVDRSASYMARYLAKNVVSADLAERCTIQIAYAIGLAKPISFYVNTHKTGLIPDGRIELILQELIDLKPKAIRGYLQLNRPIYQKTATYGHFGRAPEDDGSFSWEKVDLVSRLKGLV
jgi:S-adenosylmethionine synthetase